MLEAVDSQRRHPFAFLICSKVNPSFNQFCISVFPLACASFFSLFWRRFAAIFEFLAPKLLLFWTPGLLSSWAQLAFGVIFAVLVDILARFYG